MATLNHLAADLNNAGLYVRKGHGVLHVGLNEGKTYAISLDEVKTGAYDKTRFPARLKAELAGWKDVN